MKQALWISVVVLQCLEAFSQASESDLLHVNAGIEQAVVSKDMAFLKKHYADDFVFTHGTGFVEGKESWLKNVADPKTKFVSRVQDSTAVELHDDIGMVRGKVEITRNDPNLGVRYGIWYIRVYRFRDKRWQMLSHFTFREWHHP
ncbi:MAG: nuclear transport factor 2 family protein [Cyclobacteriaceae bacterium]|jgi:ketosteroid isomerase-like protein|nr:nuclear transport factor 2 family protein [Cyclobacteriaceae bacterium]